MWSRSARAGAARTGAAALAAGLVGALALAGCGFQPLYDPGGRERAAAGSVAPATTGGVYIAPIPERIGQQIHTALQKQINPGGQPRDPGYRLQVRVNQLTEPTNLRSDGTAVRRSLTVSAVWTLSGYDDSQQLIRSSASISSSYNVVDQPYATLAAFREAKRRAAEDLARDIAARVAGHLARQGDRAAAQPQ